jgi:lipocalin-like protein
MAATTNRIHQFLGTWKMVSASEKLKDGTSRPFKELGPEGTGYLIYSPDGHMCCALTNPHRPRWDEPPSLAQQTAAIEGLVAYAGPFEIDEVNQVVSHFPEVAWRPEWVGSRQVRHFRFDGDHLTLSSDAPEGSPEVEGWAIVWVKAT